MNRHPRKMRNTEPGRARARARRSVGWAGGWLAGWWLVVATGTVAAAPVGLLDRAHAVVAADGSGQFRSVQEAINAAPQLTEDDAPWTIRVKPGVYRELIYVMREKRFIRLRGDDAETTILTGSLYAGLLGRDNQPIGTFRTPTVWVDADDFTVENLTLANEAGPVGQALALRLDGDRIALRGCRLQGWQDTLLCNRGRHYFEDCVIAGAVDFIFGGATAYFYRCELVVEGNGYITAPSTLPYDPYGFVFVRCRIRGRTPEVRTYLGRPWRAYGAALFVETEMSEVVRPEGWHNWERPDREATARFGEKGSTGPGGERKDRVPWASAGENGALFPVTPERVLGGTDNWSPRAGGSDE